MERANEVYALKENHLENMKLCVDLLAVRKAQLVKRGFFFGYC